MEKKTDLTAILAKNLAYWMKLPTCKYQTPNALGAAAGISPNTVRYYLDEKKRPARGVKKGQGFPTMDKLVLVAEKLDCAVWELLHPDIEQSLREREYYRKVAADFERIQQGAKAAADTKSVSRLRTS